MNMCGLVGGLLVYFREEACGKVSSLPYNKYGFAGGTYGPTRV